MNGPERKVWRLDRYRDELHTVAREIGPGPFSLLQTLASGGIKGAGFLDKDTLVTRGGPASYADALGRSDRSIKRWLAQLVAVGLLIKVWKGGSHPSGQRMASRYRAVMPSDWLNGTAGQTRDKVDWHGSDQDLSARPVTACPPTRDRVSPLPHEVPASLRDGAGAPPSGPPRNGQDDDDDVERVVDFDRDQFIEELDAKLDAILEGAPSEVLDAVDVEYDRFVESCRPLSTTDRQNVDYMRRGGQRIIRRAKHRLDQASTSHRGMR